MDNGDTLRERAEAAHSRTSRDQGGNTYWDYRNVARDDPRVEADEALGGLVDRDQGGSSLLDYRGE